MTRKQMSNELLALSNLMGKTKNCTKTEWERTNKKEYAGYKAEYDRLKAEYDRKYGEKPGKDIKAVFNAGGEYAFIEKAPNGKYFNNYGYDKELHPRSPATSGGFDSYGEAEKMLYKHRPKAVKCAPKNQKSAPRKPSYDVKATYAKAAKPAVGTKEERIKRITALGLSREAAVKAIKAEDEYRMRERRIQLAMPKKPTTSSTYTVWDSKRGKTFATDGEASAYAEEHRKKTGEILTITQTKRKATHEYGKRGKR